MHCSHSYQRAMAGPKPSLPPPVPRSQPRSPAHGGRTAPRWPVPPRRPVDPQPPGASKPCHPVTHPWLQCSPGKLEFPPGVADFKLTYRWFFSASRQNFGQQTAPARRRVSWTGSPRPTGHLELCPSQIARCHHAILRGGSQQTSTAWRIYQGSSLIWLGFFYYILRE